MGRGAPVLLPLLVLAGGCEQASQKLPFEVDPDAPVSRSLGPSGGSISSPRGLALQFPQGSLPGTTQVSVSHLGEAGALPGGVEGEIVPESVFQVQPRGLSLSAPASLAIRLRERKLTPSEALRVGFAVEGPQGPLTVDDVSYDFSTGLVLGRIPALGVMAVRIGSDVIPVERSTPPRLGGGSFGGGAAPAPSASSFPDPGGGGIVSGPASGETQSYRVNCGPDPNQPRCLDSGAVRLWSSAEIQGRFTGELVLAGPRVVGNIEFRDFEGRVPRTAFGSFRVTGILRVRVGETVASYRVEELLSTGPGDSPSPTGVRVAGNALVFDQTSEGAEESFPFEIRRQGTGFQMVVEATQEVELQNADKSVTKGLITLHLRLRR